MNSEETLMKESYRIPLYLMVLAGFLFVIFLSFSTLTTKPKIWTDEAVSIELAHNFLTSGVLDVRTAPDIFSGFRERLQSTGYTVTIPLALVFKLFGFGLTQARVFMILWMIAVLVVFLWLSSALFGKKNALASFFLLISFASFYANGRTVVGEIPGFLFLLVGLYFLISREKFLLAGFFLGFSVISKLSVFGLIIPALTLTYLFEWRRFFKVLLPVALGMLPAGLLWIFISLDKPWLVSTWSNLFHFYQNPYSSSVSQNVVSNLLAVPSSATLVYFGAMFFVILLGRFFVENKWKTIYNFVLIYGVFAFVYYLRSPGWLRYILIVEFLITWILPHALGILFERFRDRLSFVALRSPKVVIYFVAVLVVFQFVQLFTVGKLYYSDSAIKTAKIVNLDFSGKSIGVLNSVDLAVLLDTSERYLAMNNLTGVPQIGINPLLYKTLPDVIISHPGDKLLLEGGEVLSKNYNLSRSINSFNIYERQ